MSDEPDPEDEDDREYRVRYATADTRDDLARRIEAAINKLDAEGYGEIEFIPLPLAESDAPWTVMMIGKRE